jgi:hypothetical protein
MIDKVLEDPAGKGRRGGKLTTEYRTKGEEAK